MKHVLILMSFVAIGLSAGATSINCGTSGSTTNCVSGDLPASNVVNINSAANNPSSSVVINSPSGRTVDVSSLVNSKPLQTNFFISNAGTPVNVNVDLSSKWDPNADTNGLSSAGSAASTLIVADMIDALNLNIKGYAGKNGKNANELCADKIMAGEYGQTIKDQFMSRCNDGTTGSPCATAKVRTACDSLDLNNINAVSGEVAGACPTGFNYLSTEDNNQNPQVSVTKVVPRTLRKCERPSYTTTARVCKWRTLECTYKFRGMNVDVDGFGIRYLEGYSNPASVVSVTGIPGHQGGSVCLSYNTSACIFYNVHLGVNSPLGTYTIRVKDSDINSTSAPRCPRPLMVENNQGTWFEGYPKSACQNGACSIFGPSGSATWGITIVDQPADPFTGLFLPASLAGSGTRTINSNENCLGAPYELDAGLVPGQVVNADVGYVEPYESCPSSNTSGIPSYGNLGLVSNHNLTSIFIGLNGQEINPLDTTAVTNCTKADCQGISTVYTSSNRIKESISLGAGERGSYGGTATVFAYDITGSQNVSFANGSNGNNGLDNLTVNPVIKNCSVTSGNGTDTPQVQFHQTFWKLFTFTPSGVSYNDSYPQRSQTDAISIFKKISPGVQDLIKQSTCTTCP